MIYLLRRLDTNCVSRTTTRLHERLDTTCVNRYACHGVVTLLYLYIDYYDLYVGIFCSLND